MDIPKPFRGNYTKWYYSNSKYFSTLLDIKLDEESNGAKFEAIPLVCGERLPKNEKHIFGGKIYKHYSKLILKHFYMLQ